MTGPVKITRAARARAKRDRICATCRAPLSGSDVGTMGEVECLWCRMAQASGRER